MTTEAAVSAIVSGLAKTARALQELPANCEEYKNEQLIGIYLEQALGSLQRFQRYGDADPVGAVKEHYTREMERFHARDTKPSSIRGAIACLAVVETLNGNG